MRREWATVIWVFVGVGAVPAQDVLRRLPGATSRTQEVRRLPLGPPSFKPDARRLPPGPASAVTGRKAESRVDARSEGLPKEVLKHPEAPSLPEVYGEVNWGIAAKYLDDAGIEKDKAVFFKVDFDDGKIPARVPGVEQDDWCGVPWADSTTVSTVAPISGRYCAANTWAATDTGGTATRWRLGTLKEFQSKYERSALFMRLYHKFDAGWYGDGKTFGMKGFGFVVQAVKHNANLACDGKNWFSSEMQWTGWGPSAKADIYKNLCIHGHYYAYMPYPGKVKATLGEEFRPTDYRFSAYANKRTWVHLDEWYCYEVAFYMNTPGRADGEARYWENGILTTHVKNVQFADTLDKFKVYALINNYRTQHDNAKGPVTRYIDNVVVADRYIGPIQFSKDRLSKFIDQGVVVHTGDGDLTRRMRASRDKLSGRDGRKR